jgi:hypothetical protein
MLAPASAPVQGRLRCGDRGTAGAGRLVARRTAQTAGGAGPEHASWAGVSARADAPLPRGCQVVCRAVLDFGDAQ